MKLILVPVGAAVRDSVKEATGGRSVIFLVEVVLLEDHSAPVVALQTWVRFGSADEDLDVAGIAHVFEHMLFKGTARFPHGEIAALIEGATLAALVFALLFKLIK